jgi:hypothetical protein
MIHNVAVIPPDVALSSFGALIAPILLVGASAVVIALVGLLIGIVGEWRDGANRARMAGAPGASRRTTLRRAA